MTLRNWLKLRLISRMTIPRPEKDDVYFYSSALSPEDVVVEVGAWHGGSTILLSSMCSQVYSFEANKHNYEHVRAVTAKMPNVNVFNIALSNTDGETVLRVGKRQSEISLVGIRGGEYSTTQKVVTRRLDNIKFDSNPTAMVIDCEGAEISVLEGAEQMLRRLRAVTVETHVLEDGTTTLQNVKEILESNNFTLKCTEDLDGMKWIIATRPPSIA